MWSTQSKTLVRCTIIIQIYRSCEGARSENLAEGIILNSQSIGINNNDYTKEDKNTGCKFEWADSVSAQFKITVHSPCM